MTFNAYDQYDNVTSGRTENSMRKRIDENFNCRRFFRVGRFSITVHTEGVVIAELYEESVLDFPEEMRQDRLRNCADAEALTRTYAAHRFNIPLLADVFAERAYWAEGEKKRCL